MHAMLTRGRRAAGAALVAFAAATAPALAPSASAADGTIVDIAVGAPQFSTLVAAVTTADLAGTLSSDGPFTVFAPTDAAFGALPAGTVESLVQPENKDQLTKILTCHVVSGEVMAQTLLGLIEQGGGVASFETVGGCVFSAIATGGGTILIKDGAKEFARVTAADIQASNGVIHAIHGVLLPAS